MTLLTNPATTYTVGTQPSHDEGMKEYLKRELQKIAIAIDTLKRAIDDLDAAVEGYHP